MSNSKIRIFVKDLEEWPQEGPLNINVWLKGEAAVTPEEACRHANDYFAKNMRLSIRADEPMLVLDEHPIWRMSIILQLFGIDHVATVGTIDVDAMTGETVPLSEAAIQAVEDRVEEITVRLSPKPKQ